MSKEKSTGDGTASMVLGILGLVFWWIILLGFVLNLLAVIYAVKQNKKQKTGQAKAGLVMGVIGLIPSSFMLFGLILVQVLAAF